jgi:peptide/nickel transport system permease protein
MRALPTSYVEGIARERASLPGGKSYTEWLQQLNQLQLDGGGVSKVFLDGLRILS